MIIKKAQKQWMCIANSLPKHSVCCTIYEIVLSLPTSIRGFKINESGISLVVLWYCNVQLREKITVVKSGHLDNSDILKKTIPIPT